MIRRIISTTNAIESVNSTLCKVTQAQKIFPFSLASPVTALTAFEAVIGLFVEISFIATFTQRFFSR